MATGQIGGLMQRARQAEQKAQRRAAILEAADALLEPESYELPAAAKIAGKAGLAKGTLYLYFTTKEEIYVALLGQEYARWSEGVMEGLSEEWPSLDHFLQRFIAFCVANPKTMFLACMGPVMLERNISEASALVFKKGLADATREVSALLSVAFPPLSVDQARKLFLHMFMLTIGVWQHTHPPEAVGNVLAQEELKALQLDFERDLYAALEALWKGYRGRR